MISLWGWLWWNVVPVRKRLAIESYRRAFPERDPAELAQTMGEIIVSYLDLMRGRRAKMIDIQIVQPGSICLCGHGVSWDLGLISAAVPPATCQTVDASGSFSAESLDSQPNSTYIG